MSKNTDALLHKKSSAIINGNPKLPSSDVLREGEIAINFAEGYETISIKNSEGTVVPFSSDEYYTVKKLGSGFTGANSANTVTSVIEGLESIDGVVVTSGETPSEDNVSLWVDTSIDPQTIEVYTKAEINNILGSGFTSSSVTEVIESNELVISAALNDLEDTKSEKT